MYLKLLAAALIIVCALLGFKGYIRYNAPDMLQTVTFNQYLGADNPEVTLIAVMDYRCPFCRKIEPILQDVIKRNPDVRIVYRVLPIFKESSLREAKLAMAAGKQGKFREMHERLIARENPVTNNDVKAYIQELGLNESQLHNDMASWQASKEIMDTVNAASELGVTGTPSLIIGRTLYKPTIGLPTVESIEKVIDGHRRQPKLKAEAAPGKPSADAPADAVPAAP